MTRPAVNADGLADAVLMAKAVGLKTRLVALMLANNETGCLQPVARLAQRGIPVHTDAVQAVGRIQVNFHALGVTTLAASAHKFHGPVGVGVLLVRRGVETCGPGSMAAVSSKGGAPEQSPVPLAVGLATALERWRTRAPSAHKALDDVTAQRPSRNRSDRCIDSGPAVSSATAHFLRLYACLDHQSRVRGP